MKQEDKDLLLKDLCARLPYGVKVLNSTYREPTIQTLFGRISEDEFNMKEIYKQVSGEDYRNVRDNVHFTGYIDYIKPYLRPMSSMTEEEEKEIREIHHQFYKEGSYITAGVFSADDCGCTVWEMSEILNYLNSHHFDYRGLIEEGLAIEAPKGMYKGE